MLYTFLLVLLIIDSLVLVAAILLQAGKGGGMAATFGGVSSSAELVHRHAPGGQPADQGELVVRRAVPRPVVRARARVDAQPRSEVGARSDFLAPPATAPATAPGGGAIRRFR